MNFISEEHFEKSPTQFGPLTTAQQNTFRDVLFSSIERLHCVSGFCDSDWNDLIQFNYREYSRMRFGGYIIPMSLVERVAAQFNISIQQIQMGQIDFHRVQREADQVNKWKTPIAYDVAKHGRSRTTITTYDFIDRLREGWRVRYDALKSVGMSECSLTNEFSSVSMRFISDTLSFLAKRQFKKSDFFDMGVHSYHSNKESILGTTLAQMSQPSEVLELMWGDCLRLLEENCKYRFLKLDFEGAIIEVRSRREVADEMGLKVLGNSHVCQLKAGMMASGSCYVGHPVAEVRETSCVHQGHDACVFEIKFVPKK